MCFLGEGQGTSTVSSLLLVDGFELRTKKGQEVIEGRYCQAIAFLELGLGET